LPCAQGYHFAAASAPRQNQQSSRKGWNCVLMKNTQPLFAAQPTEMIGSNNLGVITPKVGDKKLAHF
jgi:hypothetical protein